MYKVFIAPLFVFAFLYFAFAQEAKPLQGKVNTDKINIRSDATVGSPIISKADKGDRLEIISELYGWYKVRLPKNSDSFIKSDFIEIIDEQTAKVSGDNVNVRLHPGESSPILGKAKKGEIIRILSDRGRWYRIEPINNSFGWINKKFVDKVAQTDNIAPEKEAARSVDEASIIVIGRLKPKIMTKAATHKLITEESNLFLLKGDKEKLDIFNYKKVKVSGKLLSQSRYKEPILEIQKIEKLD